MIHHTINKRLLLYALWRAQLERYVPTALPITEAAEALGKVEHEQKRHDRC